MIAAGPRESPVVAVWERARLAARSAGGGSQVDHGFHSEDVAHRHGTLGLVFVVMWDIGDGMERKMKFENGREIIMNYIRR